MAFPSKEGCKNKLLIIALNELHETVLAFNTVISLYHFHSVSKTVESLSLESPDKGCMLSEESWLRIEQHHGTRKKI